MSTKNTLFNYFKRTSNGNNSEDAKKPKTEVKDSPSVTKKNKDTEKKIMSQNENKNKSDKKRAISKTLSSEKKQPAMKRRRIIEADGGTDEEENAKEESKPAKKLLVLNGSEDEEENGEDSAEDWQPDKKVEESSSSEDEPEVASESEASVSEEETSKKKVSFGSRKKALPDTKEVPGTSVMPSKSTGRNRHPGRRRKGRNKMAAGVGAAGSDDLDGEVELDTEESVQLLNETQRKKVSTSRTTSHTEPDENVWAVAIQVFIPFLVAGLGMVGAGLVLDIVQHWPVFKVVSEVFILVPALLGLKGNLEMTLASRLSTQANLGYMDSPKQQWSLIVGNLALIQCQATVVGFLASLAAMIMGWVPEGKFDLNHGMLLCASSLVTASLASFVLGLVMVAVIVFSRQCNINPDNVATPIAASLGDLTTLALLSWISSLLFDAIDDQPWLAPLIIGCCLILTPVWAWLARQNKFTKEVLSTGWTPVICAMLISSIGGVILDFTVANFKGIAVFQPVINGVGGNLVAVQASRISTSMHRDSKLGTLPPYANKMCLHPWKAFMVKGSHARTARVLLLMVVPGHLIFSYTISYLQAGHTSLTPIFVLVYLAAALIQVSMLLYFAQIMIQAMWVRRIDPDNSAIPYLTALGDLLGTGLLALAFQFLYLIGDRDSDVGD